MRETLKAVERWAFALMRGVLALRGRDLTAELTGRSCLVIAPHPDDETLGCGATILRATEAGHDVRVVVVADGRHSHPSEKVTPEELAEMRRVEVVAACGILGVPAERVLWLACEDRHLSRQTDQVRRRLTEIVREFGPAQVLSPSGIDRHPDHQALASVVHGLIADGVIRCPVFEYPIWFFNARTWLAGGRVTVWSLLGVFWRPVVAAFTLRPVLVKTSGTLERKRRALEAFTSQMTNITGEPGWMTLSERFLSQFFGPYETYFVPRASGRPAGAPAARAEAGHA